MPTVYTFQVCASPNAPPPVRLAASEVRRCLMLMSGENVKIKHADPLPLYEPGSILVGARPQFDEVLEGEECPANELDDEILIAQRNGNCIVTGSNPRSVLFAAYDLVEQLGARWIGPGYLGEVLPRSDCTGVFSVEVRDKASYRHRGICIEGAPSLDHALGVIDWMAKKKMNTFFLQFKTSIYFWKNYYSREYNPSYGDPEETNEARSLELDQEVIDAAKLRGLILHRVGHGWTAESIGFKGLGWWKTEEQPDDDTRELLALVGGKREFHGDVPINTELCYSNPRAFDGMVDEIVAYARAHPEVDALHFWLSDATNNFCECESCSRLTPPDWYAKLIKAVRNRMSKERIPAKVVFLCYTNTLVPPKTERFAGEEDGLIYMFAPISRCYLHPLAEPSCSGIGRAGGWPLNKVEAPRTNAEFVEIRRAWREAFAGDSFIFDYYFWAPYLRHMNPLGFAKLVNSDIRSYAELELDGLVSCQALRAFYPSGLPMAAMAETLWDRATSLDDLTQDHLRTCFGDGSGRVRDYLERLDQVLTPDQSEPHKSVLQSENLDKAKELQDLTEEYASTLPGIRSQSETHKRCIDLIIHFNRLLGMRARCSLLGAGGEKKEAEALHKEIADFLRKTEPLTSRYLDLWLLLRSMRL